MSRDELAELYRLCGTVKPVDESLIKAGLPKKETVPEPGKLRGILEEKEREGNRRKSIGIEAARAQTPDGAGGFCFSKGKYALIVGRQSLFKAFELKDEVQAFERTTPEHYPEWLWNVRAVGARKESAGTESFALNLWDRLLQVLDEIGRRVSEEALEGSRAKVVIPSSCDHDEAKAACARFISAGIGEPTWVQRTLTLRADCSAIKGITVGGKPPRNADDYRRVISFIEFRQKLPDLAELWDKLVGRAGGPLFETFGPESPELLAHDQYAKEITDALSWWRDHAKPVLEKMQDLGITVRTQSQFGIPQPIEVTRTLEEVYPKVLLWLQSCEAQSRLDQEFKDLLSVLSAETARAPAVAKPLKDCFEAKDVEGYEKNYLKLAELWKEEEDVGRLHAGFARLREVSPSWASRLASRDESLLGAGVPGKLLEAWDWGAKNIFFQQYRNENPAGIEKRGEELSKNLLKTTGSLVSCLAWLSLKDRFNDNPALLQGLRSWAQIMGMLGKGTGKNAPAIREKARRVMDRCQSGVPVWIMPMEQALRTFRGKKPFDVVILDEASQSDITALPVLFLGKKVIVAGDNRQVSPDAVGVDRDRAEGIVQRDLAGRVANWEVYQPKMSLYDVAELSYHPVMLVEHFRCVPKIIGFSNVLSYDGRIQPLRNSESTNLLPPFVLCRTDGKREEDRNKKEALTIAALVKACIRQPEYAGKSIGIISMLSGGNANKSQAAEIQRAVYAAIGANAMQKHRILCGTSAEFQGDERDVIFMSLVDSSPESGDLLRKLTEGSGDMYKKRWNVAVSRARDQVWVVYSFDPMKELAAGDLRKLFFDYIGNSDDLARQQRDVEEEAESPFESAVGKALTSRGYRLTPQYRVGSYRIDFVVSDGHRKAALECDGDQYHSSPEAVAKDLERQTVLERIGWNFVRVSGGEYFRDPDGAVDRICEALSNLGISPVPEKDFSENGHEESNLEKRIKQDADVFLRELEKEFPEETEAESDDVLTAEVQDARARTEVSRKPSEKQPLETLVVAAEKSVAEKRETRSTKEEQPPVANAEKQAVLFGKLDEKAFVPENEPDATLPVEPPKVQTRPAVPKKLVKNNPLETVAGAAEKVAAEKSKARTAEEKQPPEAGEQATFFEKLDEEDFLPENEADQSEAIVPKKEVKPRAWERMDSEVWKSFLAPEVRDEAYGETAEGLDKEKDSSAEVQSRPRATKAARKPRTTSTARTRKTVAKTSARKSAADGTSKARKSTKAAAKSAYDEELTRSNRQRIVREDKEIKAMIKASGLESLDRRDQNKGWWVIADYFHGHHLLEEIKEKYGIDFKYNPNGGRASDNMPVFKLDIRHRHKD
ncbi:MAG: AAA domain-containing protein [Sutterellaceae bacterium]|nr:AAA domain-containing protein [Sutterellaceae bacterium]MDY2867854.1 AAA domain-containing protein [Mesosutterella sp.]